MTSAGTDIGKTAASPAMRINVPIVPPELDTPMSTIGKGGKLKVVITIISLLLLLSGVTGLGWWLRGTLSASVPPETDDSEKPLDEADSASSPSATAPPAKSKAKEHSDEALLSLEPFTVNLADKEEARYMRLTVKLGLSSLKDVEKVRQDEVVAAKIRDAVLNLITSLTSDQVLSVPGKLQLRKDIVDRVNSVLPDGTAKNAYFLELVIQ